MPAPWIDAYLARIGYDGPREANAATLHALHVRHLLSVPFENLDIHWKREIVVDAERFVSKIVGERRGGFCYELNGAFAALLRALGFDVTLLSARVARDDGTFGPWFDHMALLVRADGRRFLADVGFGDSFVAPLDLDLRDAQHDRAGVFRILEAGDALQMQVLRDGTWHPDFEFTLDPHALDEFGPMCTYQQTSPQSHFTQRRVCTIAREWGRTTLADAKLVVTRSGVKSETPVAAEEWDRVLLEEFGIRALAPRA